MSSRASKMLQVNRIACAHLVRRTAIFLFLSSEQRLSPRSTYFGHHSCSGLPPLLHFYIPQLMSSPLPVTSELRLRKLATDISLNTRLCFYILSTSDTPVQVKCSRPLICRCTGSGGRVLTTKCSEQNVDVNNRWRALASEQQANVHCVAS